MPGEEAALMASGTARVVRILAGAGVGASVWLSLGTLALVSAGGMTRVGALPGWAWLAGLAGVGAATAALVPGSGRHAAPLALLGLLWLPWLPAHVPAAFLLWEGPLEGVVWLAATGGVAWPVLSGWRARAGGSALWRSPATAPWVAAALAAATFASAWAIARPRVPAGDEPHYLVITQSVLRDGDLRIENNHRDGQYLAYFDGVLKPDFMRRGTDRQIYSIHAPGLSVLVLPGFVVAGYAGAVVTVVLLGALGVALLWRAAFTLTDSADAAWMGAIATIAAAPVVLHGFTVYPDPVAGTSTMLAVGALIALDRGQPWSMRAAVTTGAALAALPWLHTRFALVAGVLGLALVARLTTHRDRRRHIAGLLAVPAVSAVAWFAYFWLIYGTPNPAAPYGTRPEGGLPFVPAGLAGLLVDQQFGLLSNAPVLVVGLVALVALARWHRRLAVEIGAVMLPYAAATATYPMWWAGYSAPARFLVAVLPVLALPLAVAWAQGGGVVRGLVAGTTVASAGISAALVGIDRGAFIYNGRDGHALLLDWLSQTVDLTLALPSVHRDGAWTATADAAVWIVTAVFVLALARRFASAEGATWRGPLAGWVAGPVVVMLAASIVWAAYRRDIVLTPSTSQMAWLGRSDAGRSTLAVQLTPTRGLAAGDIVRRLELATSPRGGRRAGPQPLLQIPNVPPGRYDVVVEGQPSLAGTLTVRLGRQDLPMETWALGGRSAGLTGLTLEIPIGAHSITIAGDDTARAAVHRLTLRPTAVGRPGGLVALRAVRYGGVVLFALDDQAFVERDALWVRGERTAAFVVRPDPGRPALVRLKAGPVANQVRLAAGAWRHDVDLAPDATVDVPLPDDALAPAILSVTSTTGFRPSLTADVRWLGVYVTWPAPLAGAPPTR